MAIINDIVEFLAADCERHSINEIALTLNLSPTICHEIVTFLAKYEFVQLDENVLTITPRLQALFTELPKKPLLA